MNRLKKIQERFFKTAFFAYNFFISLKLAVCALLALAVLTGIGTFVESRYNQEMANKLVYGSFWMSAAVFLLALSLAMVLIDRWPWKKKQTGFVLAHIGILTLIFGSLWTRHFGLDGSLRFKEGEKASSFSLPDMEIKIYSSYDGDSFSLIYEAPADMFFFKPRAQKPYVIQTAGEKFAIDRYLPFALGREAFQPVEKGGGPALRFHLSGSQASLSEWIRLDFGERAVSQTFGPALVTLTKDKNYKAPSDKELVLFVEGERAFYSLGGGQKKEIRPGSVFDTGWMDFKFRLLEFFPKSQREFVFEAKDRPSSATVKAIRLGHRGNFVWLGQNSYVRLFREDRVYAVAYLNKSHNLGFDLELLDFRIAKYQGSEKAKSYESLVRFEGQEALISMNKPLKRAGWTFYQSSFEPSEGGGAPVVSILSVNRDPGRPIKYFGSALIVLGIALLFYRRKIRKKI